MLWPGCVCVLSLITEASLKLSSGLLHPRTVTVLGEHHRHREWLSQGEAPPQCPTCPSGVCGMPSSGDVGGSASAHRLIPHPQFPQMLPVAGQEWRAVRHLQPGHGCFETTHLAMVLLMSFVPWFFDPLPKEEEPWDRCQHARAWLGLAWPIDSHLLSIGGAGSGGGRASV